jgi:peptidoglycan/LPS O-acetylase OafA/YrhL
LFRLTRSLRLPTVDGLRAIAALWVVAFHITAFSHARFPGVPGLDLFLSSGSIGVSLFLVLSGFCLFLPFAAGRAARFNTREFFRRRFRRLAPAYYASLLLSFVLLFVTTGPLAMTGLSVTDMLRQLVTHLIFAHTLFPDTFYALNGAYWSLGLEWQLYLGLPLLILGMRRFGLARVIAVVLACNVVYTTALGIAGGRGLLHSDYVLHNQLFGRWAEFAFGMVAAELFAGGRLTRLARHVPAMVATIAVLAMTSVLAGSLELRHIVYGALFFTLLCLALVSENPVARVLSWRPFVALGTMSYSLYLIHEPIVQTVGAWFDKYDPAASPYAVFALMVGVVFPIILLLAWVLFVTVERPTLSAASSEPRISRWRWQRPVTIVASSTAGSTSDMSGPAPALLGTN